MVKKQYLMSTEIVKKFKFLVADSTELKSLQSKISYLTPKYGNILYAQKLSKTSFLSIVNFKNSDKLKEWQNQFLSSTIYEVVEIKVLLLTNDNDNDDDLDKTYTDIINKLPLYCGHLLFVEKSSKAEYRLILFFQDKKKMLCFTKDQGIIA